MLKFKIAGKSFFELRTGGTTEGAAPHAQIRPRLVRGASQCKGTAVPSLTPEKRLFALVGVLFRNLTHVSRGVWAVKVRYEAPCYPTKKSPSLLHCYRFWSWFVAGRGEYPRRTGGNEQVLGQGTPWELRCVLFYKHQQNPLGRSSTKSEK